MRSFRDVAVLTLNKQNRHSANLILWVTTMTKIARDRSAGAVLASSLLSIAEVIW